MGGRRGLVVSASALRLGGPQFESQLGKKSLFSQISYEIHKKSMSMRSKKTNQHMEIANAVSVVSSLMIGLSKFKGGKEERGEEGLFLIKNNEL